MRMHVVVWLAVGLAALIAGALPTVAATETVLYRFPNSGTGFPEGYLYLRNGSLYGTAAGNGRAGYGQVFELTNTGRFWHAKTLATFDSANGSWPSGGLVHD